MSCRPCVWYTRNIINRFIVGQSRYERELAKKLDLTLGRTLKGRCLMVTVIVVEMESKSFPWSMIERLRNTPNAVLMPAKPALIDGKERWAWLEINPEDYRTIAVIDTGERGAMLEHVLGNWQQEGTNFIVGGLIGVDAAIWSMGAFSLKLEDYDEIKAQAEAFALGLAGNFGADLETFEQKAGDATVSGGVGVGIGGTPGAAVSMGPISASFDIISGKGAVSQNVLGYGNGFKAGVMLFFSR